MPAATGHARREYPVLNAPSPATNPRVIGILGPLTDTLLFLAMKTFADRRKRIEQPARQLQQELIAGEQRQRDLFEPPQRHAAGHNAEGSILMANREITSCSAQPAGIDWRAGGVADAGAFSRHTFSISPGLCPTSGNAPDEPAANPARQRQDGKASFCSKSASARSATMAKPDLAAIVKRAEAEGLPLAAQQHYQQRSTLLSINKHRHLHPALLQRRR